MLLMMAQAVYTKTLRKKKISKHDYNFAHWGHIYASLSSTWSGAFLSRGGTGGQTLCRKCCLNHQLHTHVPQPAVGVCGHITVRYQLVAISEVPDVVNGSSGFEVPAGVMKPDFEDHVLTTKENIVRQVHRSLLGDADCQRDLI